MTFSPKIWNFTVISKHQIYKSIRHIKLAKLLKFAPQFVNQNKRQDFYVFGKKLSYMSSTNLQINLSIKITK